MGLMVRMRETNRGGLRLPAWLAGLTLLLSCSYGPPSRLSRIIDVSRQPETRRLAILTQQTELRQPTGLSTFPDGGKARILADTVVIDLYDIDSDQLTTLCRLPSTQDQSIDFSADLTGWQHDRLYLSTTGCAPTWNWNRGCWGQHINRKTYRLTSSGRCEPIDTLPAGLREGRNSPVVPLPDELNYVRVGFDRSSVSVTLTYPGESRAILRLDDSGLLTSARRP